MPGHFTGEKVLGTITQLSQGRKSSSQALQIRDWSKSICLGGLEVFHNFFNTFDDPPKIVNRNFRAHQILQDIVHDPPVFFQQLSQHTRSSFYKIYRCAHKLLDIFLMLFCMIQALGWRNHKLYDLILSNWCWNTFCQLLLSCNKFVQSIFDI